MTLFFALRPGRADWRGTAADAAGGRDRRDAGRHTRPESDLGGFLLRDPLVVLSVSESGALADPASRGDRSGWSVLRRFTVTLDSPAQASPAAEKNAAFKASFDYDASGLRGPAAGTGPDDASKSGEWFPAPRRGGVISSRRRAPLRGRPACGEITPPGCGALPRRTERNTRSILTLQIGSSN